MTMTQATNGLHEECPICLKPMTEGQVLTLRATGVARLKDSISDIPVDGENLWFDDTTVIITTIHMECSKS